MHVLHPQLPVAFQYIVCVILNQPVQPDQRQDLQLSGGYSSRLQGACLLLLQASTSTAPASRSPRARVLLRPCCTPQVRQQQPSRCHWVSSTPNGLVVGCCTVSSQNLSSIGRVCSRQRGHAADMDTAATAACVSAVQSHNCAVLQAAAGCVLCCCDRQQLGHAQAHTTSLA